MVHIMLAAYNGEKFIKEQIESIVQQTYKNWKLFISDDSTNQSTQLIIDKYIDKYRNKIILLPKRIRQNGAKGNFSYLFNKVEKADYYLFCDQDDVWKKDKLEYLVRIIERMDSSIPILLYHDIQVVDKNMNKLCSTFQEYSGIYLRDKKSFQQLLINNCIPGCSMLFNNTLKETVGKIPVESGMHDWWVVIVAKCFNGEIIHINKILGYYRQHTNNEIGALQKVKLVSYVKRSFKLWEIKNYKKNNNIMKAVCNAQVNALIDNYSVMVSEENLSILYEFKQIITSNKKFRNLVVAIIKGYTFNSIPYTIKFYCI